MELIPEIDDGSPPLKRQKIDAVGSDSRIITINKGANGSLLVWDPTDAIVLQRQYRIVGIPSGCLSKTSLQDIFQSVPLRISAVEAAYLRDKGLARFMDEYALVEPPSVAEQEAYRTERNSHFEDQKKVFAQKRLERIEAKKDDIIEGKITKLKATGGITDEAEIADREKFWETLKEDLLSRPIAREGFGRVQLPTRSWKIEMGLVEAPLVDFQFPNTREERVQYAAYSALMDAGFWLTSGIKYGGDYLLYEGDVHLNHSTCIVKIVDESADVTVEEYLRVGRVATSCHKALLWVSVNEDLSVSFTCGKWALMK